jgi:hypothetical protein
MWTFRHARKALDNLTLRFDDPLIDRALRPCNADVQAPEQRMRAAMENGI